MKFEFTLDSILGDLEKTAGFPENMDAGKDDKKDEKKDSKDSKDEKKDDKKDEDKKDGQEKSAAFKAGADLAKEIMEKVASTKTEQTNKGEEMNKQASDAGKALAQALLKQAGVGDTNTSNGIPAGVVPNKTQVDLAQQKAEHDQSFQATPGTDGAGNGGTVNQIFDAIVADALGRTGAKDEHVTGGVAAAEGAINHQAPAQGGVAGPAAIGGESQEKTAALVSLVNGGMDFDEAVNLVKQASDELEAEHQTHVKAAAFNELLAQGVSFTEAAKMVKAASAKEAKAADVDQEKQAAVNALVESGVDFDQAIDLVNAKADELYGK